MVKKFIHIKHAEDCYALQEAIWFVVYYMYILLTSKSVIIIFCVFCMGLKLSTQFTVTNKNFKTVVCSM